MNGIRGGIWEIIYYLITTELYGSILFFFCPLHPPETAKTIPSKTNSRKGGHAPPALVGRPSYALSLRSSEEETMGELLFGTEEPKLQRNTG